MMARIFILKQKFTDKGKLALLHEFVDEQCSFNIQVFLAACETKSDGFYVDINVKCFDFMKVH